MKIYFVSMIMLPQTKLQKKMVPAESIAAVESSDDDFVVEPNHLTLQEASEHLLVLLSLGQLCASKQLNKGGKVCGRCQ